MGRRLQYGGKMRLKEHPLLRGAGAQIAKEKRRGGLWQNGGANSLNPRKQDVMQTGQNGWKNDNVPWTKMEKNMKKNIIQETNKKKEQVYVCVYKKESLCYTAQINTF